MNPISLQDWLTTSNIHPDRAAEATDEIKQNAVELLAKVNAFLVELGWTGPTTLSSGYRTAAANAATPGAAAHSGHEIGKALDIHDVGNVLGKIVAAHPELLRKHDLMMEDNHSTPTWCHLDDVARHDRPSRIFIP